VICPSCCFAACDAARFDLRARQISRQRRRVTAGRRSPDGASRVEERRGSLGHAATLRFLSPLIKPDVPISGIRLSDWFHRKALGALPSPGDTAFLGRIPIFSGVSRRIANHLILAFFVSAPEVRVLPSTGVTRLHRYYVPVRLPFRPSPFATSRPLPSPKRVSPVACITLPPCRAHYPGGSDGCARRLLPHLCGLPRIAGGSASASSLSRPAQASLTLRPAGLLDRPRRPLSRGFSATSYPATLLVSYQTYRQLSGWFLPPLVIHAFRGTQRNPGRS